METKEVFAVYARGGVKVGEYSTLKRACRAIDRKDNAYGACVHYYKREGGAK